jgi:hypothetical protein
MRPGADAQRLTQRAVAMKRIFCQILGCWVAVFVITASHGAMAQPQVIRAVDETGSFCLDGMETVPIEDDLVPTPIAVDGGCMVAQAVVSI